MWSVCCHISNSSYRAKMGQLCNFNLSLANIVDIEVWKLAQMQFMTHRTNFGQKTIDIWCGTCPNGHAHFWPWEILSEFGFAPILASYDMLTIKTYLLLDEKSIPSKIQALKSTSDELWPRPYQTVGKFSNIQFLFYFGVLTIKTYLLLDEKSIPSKI